MTQPITSFSGEHRFLSNFWAARVVLDGITYWSVENAYQAAKTNDMQARSDICQMTAGEAKRAGRIVVMRPDWDAVKLDVMANLNHQKYWNDDVLARKLIATGDAELIEGNHWGDTFWGVCRGRGENHLGKILMQIRNSLAATYGT